jgi:hypothetical protein
LLAAAVAALRVLLGNLTLLAVGPVGFNTLVDRLFL